MQFWVILALHLRADQPFLQHAGTLYPAKQPISDTLRPWACDFGMAALRELTLQCGGSGTRGCSDLGLLLALLAPDEFCSDRFDFDDLYLNLSPLGATSTSRDTST